VAERLDQLLQMCVNNMQANSRARTTPLFSLTGAIDSPEFAQNNLSDTESGFIAGNLQIFVNQYRGMQECPWGCGIDPLSSYDFLILNRNRAASITGPGLIVHLIRDHHFFEGEGSPYRVDPQKLAAVLELIPKTNS